MVSNFMSIIKRMNNFVVQYLSDIDFYKLTMLQFILHNFPGATAKYKFKNRTKDVNLKKYVEEINNEFDWLCTLRFQPFEIEHASKIPYFKPDFIYFLQLFRLNRKWIKIYGDEKTNELIIEAEGPWLHVMMFEIYTLEIVEEVYTRNKYKNYDMTEGRKRLQNKIDMILEFTQSTGIPFPMIDFGTRRRFSSLWHEEVIFNSINKLPKEIFLGTSNVLLANLYNIQYFGTMAHEVLQAGQALAQRPIEGQIFILDKWAREYRGELGIALTDTLGFKKFLKDFDKYFAKLYDGGRHDSEDPYKWVDDFIDHYKKLKIDPMTKIAMYSDGLNVPKSIDLARYSYNRVKYTFGLGTNWTNDVGIVPLQLVMKIIECNGQPVAKMCDDRGKWMCEDKAYSENLYNEIQKELSLK
jgi:nicotinate phosphoribosyltransferase